MTPTFASIVFLIVVIALNMLTVVIWNAFMWYNYGVEYTLSSLIAEWNKQRPIIGVIVGFLTGAGLVHLFWS